MKEKLNEDVEVALKKKAFGYDTEEVVEEFVEQEGEIKLSKKKITKKNVPPDINALKMILDSKKDISDLSDEELEAEKIRLLGLLKDLSSKGEKNCKKAKELKQKNKNS